MSRALAPEMAQLPVFTKWGLLLGKSWGQGTRKEVRVEDTGAGAAEAG